MTKKVEESSVMRKALAEQHRNTRHDACDKINEISNRWEKSDFDIDDLRYMMNEITSAIMNLKQREPK